MRRAQCGRNSGAILAQFGRNSGAVLRNLSDTAPPLLRYANQLRRLEGTQSGNGSKAALPELPQLYLNGQRIGSLAEMKALNEDGQLSARLDEFRMEYIYDAGEVDCAACGGKRFVVCATCSGTKRGRIMFGKAMKCAMCNENGLMACPSCNTDELERSMTMAPAGYSGKLDRRSIVRS